MPRHIFPFFLLLASASTAQQYLGVQTWGGNDADQLNALALDAQARIFALGGFRGTADMDPGAGGSPFTAVGGQDIFLSRFTAEGQWEWSAQLGGDMHDHAQALAVHGDAVYLGGEFADTLEATTGELVSNGSSDAVLAHYDLDGNWLWAVSAGSTGSDYINDVAVDAAGNVLAIGYFQGTVDFDPGPNEFPVTGAGDAMFLWKVSPVGELMWVRTWNGSSSENGMALAVGAAGDSWIGGGFYGDLDLNPGTGMSLVNAPGFEQNAFLIHLDADGDFLFGCGMGGNGSDAVHDLKLDAQGAVIAVGAFGDTGDFDPGLGVAVLVHTGGPDSFVVKFSATGQLIQAVAIASAGYDQPRAVEVGPAGGIMITGGFDGTIDLDPGSSAAELTSNGVSDVYVVLLDSALNYMEGAAWGGTGTEDGTSLCWSVTGRRYVGGLFEYTVDFDPGAGVDEVTSNLFTRDAFLTHLCSVESIVQEVTIPEGDSLFLGGAWQTESGTYTEVYTAASGCDSLLVTELTVEPSTSMTEAAGTIGMRVYPVPAWDVLTIELDAPEEGMRLEIIDAMGRRVQEMLLPNATVHAMVMSVLTPGMYIARLTDGSGTQAVFLKGR
jgi:hypothetical protein